MAVANQKNGLYVDILPVDTFVRINNLEPVTNCVMLDGGGRNFTPDGVLSNEIFGISTYDRQNRFAYIELYTHYMVPLAAIKLASYDRKLADVLYSRGRYILTKDGELIADPDGKSGPEFLYQIWGKVKVKDKDTVTTKEIQTFYEQPRDVLFCTKYPVIPAFYRDINKAAMKSGDPYEIKKSSAIINNKYNNLISYTQSMNQYTDTFTGMAYVTQARVQSLIVEIYEDLMIKKVKGSPSKFGMLRRSLAGKNLPYTARLVLTASNQNKSSLSQVQTKYGYATIPLMYVCAIFMPFMVHELKAYFDATFLQGGKYPTLNEKGEVVYVTISESFDENEITNMIVKFINSPESRFDKVKTPPDTYGNRYNMMLTGRFNKDNSTMNRDATLTDILYIVAHKVVADKHVDITRYPMDNPNGQNPYRIIISTTMKTEPMTIGETVYEFYPVIEGDPLNVFMTTGQISNVMIARMGADFDGDQVSIRPRWSKESNADAERLINSPGYTLDVGGKNMRELDKDFILNSYLITRTDNPNLKDINKVKPKYVI